MSNRPLRFALALSALVAITGVARADDYRDMDHGRRDEVNDRLRHREARIREERREAALRAERAREMHHRDREYRIEER